MQIDARDIDDFKTERKDVVPPLAPIFRLVPFLFYGSLLALAVVGAMSFLKMRAESQKRDQLNADVTSLNAEIEQTKAQRAALESEIRKATDMEAWVLGSMPIQPLVVAIARSMETRSSIVDLTIERDADNPAQLKLALRLNTDSDKQLEKTLDVIRSMNYREFSPTQTMVRGDLDYRATLIWTDPNRGARQEEAAQ